MKQHNTFVYQSDQLKKKKNTNLIISGLKALDLLDV